MKQAILQLKDRIEKTIQHVQTEEATKNAFIMPFLQALGYDVFNPTEVVPEFTADIGIKTGEKVDYAIMIGGMPMILIECKQCANELNVQNESQLLRYFNVTKAKFGILTNGLVYQFYTDLEEPNIMDLKPFLSFDVRECDKINYTELNELMNMIIVFMTFCLKYNITFFLIFCFPNARNSFKKIYSSLVNRTSW